MIPIGSAAIDPAGRSVSVDSSARAAVDPAAICAMNAGAPIGSVADHDSVGWRRTEAGERYRHTGAFEQTRSNHTFLLDRARAPVESGLSHKTGFEAKPIRCEY
jgi:hypothetical protein